MQRTGFMPYFLCAWQPIGKDSWDSLRSRALTLDGPTARQIARQIARQTLVSVSVEVIR